MELPVDVICRQFEILRDVRIKLGLFFKKVIYSL
jgi:hypothetical protein